MVCADNVMVIDTENGIVKQSSNSILIFPVCGVHFSQIYLGKKYISVH